MSHIFAARPFSLPRSLVGSAVGLVLFAMLASMMMCRPHKFEALYRSGQTLQSAVDTNVTFARYNELVLAMNTELTMATEKVADAKDADLLNLYGAALASYTDALTLWMLKEQRKNDLLERHPVLENIVEKYDVTFENDMIPVEAAIKKIWPIAKAQLDKANARYNGR